MRRVHKSQILQSQVNVALVGCGGNGCQMLNKLFRLHSAMVALGRGALQVDVYDPDIVTTANRGRQLFYEQDIGLHKAVVLVNRLNAACPELGWNAYPMEYDGRMSANAIGMSPYNVVVVCVDTGRARLEIHEAMRETHDIVGMHAPYWLDLGNEASTGQAHLGQLPVTAASTERLMNWVELKREWFSGEIPESNEPSCSLAEALGRQELFVNDAVSTIGAQLLCDLLIGGCVETAGAYVDVRARRSTPIPLSFAGGPSTSMKPRRVKNVR